MVLKESYEINIVYFKYIFIFIKYDYFYMYFLLNFKVNLKFYRNS